MPMQQLLIDFSESSETAGFRLHDFEVLNWGTFHRHVWSLPSDGGNSLLTGDIGSGKSTLVDGLTTLLVPPRQIVYNKAAGAESRERDLRSYVMGYYKSEKNSETLEAKAVALRDQKSFSVLLARFYNTGYDLTTTLALVIWLPDKTRPPERFYVVSENRLSIQADFSGFGSDIRKLKKRLKKEKKCWVFDSFIKYSAAFMRRMGIENSQALDLFYQTVSMKSVGNLTGFVRIHMLETPPVAGRIEELCRQFEDLNRAHEAVRRARKQVSLLEPLMNLCKQYTGVSEGIAQHLDYRAALPGFFAQKRIVLLKDRLARLEKEKLKLEAGRKQIRDRLDSLKQHEQELRLAIHENGGSRLENLKVEIQRLTAERIRLKEKEKRYLELCRALSLAKPTTENTFLNNRSQAGRQQTLVDEQILCLENDRVENRVRLKEMDSSIETIEAELLSLKKRKSNIPLKNISIRNKLCRFVGVEETVIPFCGELIRVKDDEKEWEGTIERMLHHFGLSLLVPDTLYPEVAEFVDGHDLGGRLVYYKTREGRPHAMPEQDLDPDALCRKLEIKAGTLFYEWLESELVRRFNSVCCEDMTAFRRLPFAVTRQGQIKSNGRRHEKDDRFFISDRSRYILGWQNQDKIKALTRELDRLKAVYSEKRQALEKAEAERKKLKSTENSLMQFLAVETFAEINWRRPASEIETLESEIREIEKSADILDTLSRQLAENLTQAAGLEKEKEKITGRIGKIEGGINALSSSRELSENILDQVPQEDRDAIFLKLAELQENALGRIRLNLKNCDSSRNRMRDWLQDRIKGFRVKKERLVQEIVRMMQAYKNEYPRETREVDAHVDGMDEYGAMLDTLIREDLPRHEKKFKTMLNEGTIQNMALFQSKLESELADIREKISLINLSLSAIDYNDGSYIRLVTDQSRDVDVRQFRQDLKACMGQTLTGKDDEDYNEHKFVQVKAIIDRFKGREGRSDLDGRWTKKVTDVRNWLVFSASEQWREDDGEKEFFSDTGGKSGGQKEKLAYTILAAALAYQFGLKWGEKRSNSFRFVMIDEAFGRGSDESTRYALELFSRLNLQLLIVTPMQKTHIIEDYVRSVHFIHNEDGRNSMIRNLTIEEYQEEKKVFQEAMS